MRAALLQLTSSDQPEENLATVTDMLREAAAEGAGFVLTPEVTNCVSASRAHQNSVLTHEANDPVLAGLREEAARAGIWLLIGSLALKTDDADERFANRSFLIGPEGRIVSRYDKIHMFDVQVSDSETYRESAGFRPGRSARLAQTPFGTLGLTVCYDVRFPYLYRALAQEGAEILTVPSAFSQVTGAAHWEPLLRARAIETGAWVLAPAQTGTHRASRGKARKTWGHSIVVDPWGAVVAQAGVEPQILYAEMDRDAAAQARRRVPSLEHDREFDGP
jgi:predicted amidohydrolase